MQARNAEGYQVSLLNDEALVSSPSSAQTVQPYPPARPVSFQAASHVLSRPYPSSRSSSSSPMTPELLRSDSYDSQMSNDPISPLTPSVDYAYPRSALYPSMDGALAKRPAYVDSSRSTSFDDDSAPAPTMADQRPVKRYPCRYRDTHGCEKTFTTSGHASRHSKIHTAEKAVQCTYFGCHKKFTRADNMKQHLETHFKDKDKGTSAGASRAHKATEASRTSSRGRSSTAAASAGSLAAREGPHWDGDRHHHHPHHHHHHHSHSHHRRRQMHTSPLSSPTASASWDMSSINLPVLGRPAAARSHSNGLDALAMAVACQEGGS